MQHSTVENRTVFCLSARNFALIAMLLTSILMSFNGLIVRNIDHAGPWQINIYRSIAFIVTIITIRIFQRRHKSVMVKRPRALFRLNPPAIWAGLCLGVTGVCITQALTTTTIANTMFILSATPFLTMVIAYIFLKELLSLANVVAIGIAAIGILIMVYDARESAHGFGNLMAVLTALGLSSFTVILRAHRHLDMFPALIVGGLIVIAASILPNSGSEPISAHDLALCILWGAGLSGFAHWAIVAASNYLNAAELTLFTLLEFALGPIWVWQFIGEVPTRAALIGGLIVISSVTIKFLSDLRMLAPQESA